MSCTAIIGRNLEFVYSVGHEIPSKIEEVLGTLDLRIAEAG